jgi:hypothetical protein
MALLELLIRPLCSGVGDPLTSFQLGRVIDGSWSHDGHAQGRVSNGSAAENARGEGGLLHLSALLAYSNQSCKPEAAAF